jgi:hypothetical protein
MIGVVILVTAVIGMVIALNWDVWWHPGPPF